MRMTRSCLGTGTSINSSVIGLVFWVPATPLNEMMWSWKCFPPLSKMPTLTYNFLTSSMPYVSPEITRWRARLALTDVIPGFCVVRVAQLIFVCLVFYISFFAFFLLAIVLSVLRFTASDYSFTDDPIHHFLWHPTHPFIPDTWCIVCKLVIVENTAAVLLI